MTGEGVVIVGGGAAGLSVARSLRSFGFDQKITLIGDEAAAPYDRPPLSKQVLSGEWDMSRTQLMDSTRLDELDLTMLTSTRADSLDVEAHTIAVTGRDGVNITVPYESAVIATGVTPARLPGSDATNIHVLHTQTDAELLSADLVTGARLVIIGAGFLGLETAATARSLGVEVDIVSLEPSVPLLPKIGDVAASQLLIEHESRGVAVHVGVGVHQFVKDGARVTAVKLTDGTVLPADVVLMAIGSRPNVAWLDKSDLTVEDGVLCDEYSSAGTDVWAAGDVARWRHTGLGYTIRMEHRSNASEQAAIVAKNILGGREEYVPIPYFWTDHYGVKIQVAGFMPPHADHRVVDGTPGEGSFVQEFTVAGHLVGALTWNSPRELSRYRRRLMDTFEENGRRWDLGALGG